MRPASLANIVGTEESEYRCEAYAARTRSEKERLAWSTVVVDVVSAQEADQ